MEQTLEINEHFNQTVNNMENVNYETIAQAAVESYVQSMGERATPEGAIAAALSAIPTFAIKDPSFINAIIALAVNSCNVVSKESLEAESAKVAADQPDLKLVQDVLKAISSLSEKDKEFANIIGLDAAIVADAIKTVQEKYGEQISAKKLVEATIEQTTKFDHLTLKATGDENIAVGAYAAENGYDIKASFDGNSYQLQNDIASKLYDELNEYLMIGDNKDLIEYMVKNNVSKADMLNEFFKEIEERLGYSLTDGIVNKDSESVESLQELLMGLSAGKIDYNEAISELSDNMNTANQLLSSQLDDLLENIIEARENEIDDYPPKTIGNKVIESNKAKNNIVDYERVSAPSR